MTDIHIPALVIYLLSIALVILLGSGITAVGKLTARVRALEERLSQATNPKEVADALKKRILRELE